MTDSPRTASEYVEAWRQANPDRDVLLETYPKILDEIIEGMAPDDVRAILRGVLDREFFPQRS